MWQNASSVDEDLVLDFDVLSDDRRVLSSAPLSEVRLPTDDGGVHEAVVSHSRAVQQNGGLDANTVTDDDTLSYRHMGSNRAVLSNLCRWILEDSSDHVCLDHHAIVC